MKKILLINCYFGSLPEYFNFYMESVRFNSTVDFLLVTDDKTPRNYPKNLIVEYSTFEEIRTKMQELFDFEIALNSSYKLCDFRPVFGRLFYDRVKNYDFWGYADIDVILSLGIEVKFGVKIGRDVTLDELRRDYDSVYISIGAHADKKLRIEGEDADGVISAVELLGGIGDRDIPDFTGKNVVIVGGGNVAMDVTRTSMRLGAKSVKCLYRRRIEDMTALPEEIEGAIAEGCEIIPLMAPSHVEVENGKVKGLVVKPQVIGAYNRGRPMPYNANLPEVTVPCDIIIVAIGQAIESKHFAESGAPLAWDQIDATKTGAVPGLDGVFSGGDCVSGPSTVIKAIEAGKVAAANIDEYLGFHTEIKLDVEIPVATYKFKPACGRVNNSEREADERKHDFDLMEKPMTEEEAMQECSRCLRCDHYGCATLKGGRVNKW